MFETGSCLSGGVWRTTKWRKQTSYGRNGGPIDREGCGVPQNGQNGPPTVETGVLFIGRGVAYRKTGLHGVLFNHPSTTTPPLSIIHPALHAMGSCSTTPPRPPLHRLLFIQPSTPRGPVHPEATPPLTVHPTPPATLTVHPIDRLQLAAVAKESLDRLQLTAIDRSLGFSNV